MNRITELEIAFFRLGNLALVIDSIKDQSESGECTALVQLFIEKAVNVGLAK